MTEDVLICDCGSCEHQIVVRFDEEEKEMYLNIHLFKYGFWRRLVAGVKFIFGYHSIYGDWDSFLFGPDHAEKLRYMASLLDGKTHSVQKEWQVCPVCHGSGKVGSLYPTTTALHSTCTVCSGLKIIERPK